MPLIVELLLMTVASISTAKINKRAESGQPWQMPRVSLKLSDSHPLFLMTASGPV